jgi:16S rRNA C967 or C1407 C5-methylase (RsmB/RsmF family)
VHGSLLNNHFCCCRVTRGMQAVLASSLLQQGILAVQDEAAGLVVALLDPQPGDTVLDTCAAPGSKAIYAAQRMRELARQQSSDADEDAQSLQRILQQAGTVVALDASPARQQLTQRAVRAAGLQSSVHVGVGDVTQLANESCAAVVMSRCSCWSSAGGHQLCNICQCSGLIDALHHCAGRTCDLTRCRCAVA